MRVLARGLLDQVGNGHGLGQVDGVTAGTPVTAAPVRSAIARCADGGIIRSSLATTYRLSLIRQATSLIVPPSAFTPQGTWESAMNAACRAGQVTGARGVESVRSRNRKPSLGGRIGGWPVEQPT
jgi:hypothetical protein